MHRSLRLQPSRRARHEGENALALLRRRRRIYPQPSWLKSLPSFRSRGQPRRALATDPTLVLGYSCTGDHEAKSGVEDVIPAALPDSRSSR
jgi:hypothetical protein